MSCALLLKQYATVDVLLRLTHFNRTAFQRNCSSVQPVVATPHKSWASKPATGSDGKSKKGLTAIMQEVLEAYTAEVRQAVADSKTKSQILRGKGGDAMISIKQLPATARARKVRC